VLFSYYQLVILISNIVPLIMELTCRWPRICVFRVRIRPFQPILFSHSRCKLVQLVQVLDKKVVKTYQSFKGLGESHDQADHNNE
jgi:hypothetical protein